jgi:EAL domain-containing protein (putative c-di-GMP-specific phosphodiesterase class I)
MGIDYAQGFYLDKPEHIDERIENIKNNTAAYPAQL